MNDVCAVQVPRRSLATGLTGVGILLAVLVTGLLWSKWLPYADRTATLAVTHDWSGSAIFGAAGTPGSTPSVAGAWAFTQAYAAAVWKAALVGLLVAAALDSVVPQRWIIGLLSRRTSLGQGVLGGVLSMPSMMCSCCTSPVAVGLRRRGAPLAATVSYWLGNPLLNPAVLVFLVLTLPWQFAATRLLVGFALVVGSAVLVDRLLSERSAPASGQPLAAPPLEEPVSVAQLPGRFVRSFARLAVVLVPEYLALVLLIGAFSGLLSDFAGLDTAAGPLALLLVGLVGAALVIPTGGEIPVVTALVAAGASMGAAGALLITLPALSVPSIVMVWRAFGARALAVVTATVVTGGLAAGLMLGLIA